MKRSTTWLYLITWPTIASLPLLPLVLYAADLPTGATVTAGKVSISTPASGNMLLKQDTQRAIIKWNEFNIGSTSSVTFAQPNASSATLNIVTGSNASLLAGSLKANGSIFLVNENGITVTSTGLVDTRTGFIASSLPLGEADFMAGTYRFNGQGGVVSNQGKIRTGLGGTVALIGQAVSNDGLIEAPLGKVALGSAQAATLDIHGDGFLQVILPTTALQANGEALVSNSGTIIAEGGSVMLKAATVREALRNAVSMSGDIQARAVSGHNGAVVLEGGKGGEVAVSGRIDVSAKAVGITGGVIDVSGDSVVLQGAHLDASALDQGGLVRVGGAFQGGRAQKPGSPAAAPFLRHPGSGGAIGNARTTLVDAASSINISASGPQGSGGTAVVWSDSITDMLGSIAGGGARTAGAVEISSAAHVRAIDLPRISLGKGGTLLLDPKDISIESVGVDPIANYAYSDNLGNVTRLRASDLTGMLSTGASVSLQASRDISWLDNFSFVTRTSSTPGGTLNLSAGRSITLSGIFETGGGNWNLVANDTAAHGVVDADRSAGFADINLINANFINSNGALNLTLASGTGNTYRDASRMMLPKYSGDSLTATIAPGVDARVEVFYDINVSGDVTLTGNLRLVNDEVSVTVSGRRVNWTDEKTGGTVRGYGDFKFVENGIVTRLAELRGRRGDATQLSLGDNFAANILSREYGDTNPTVAQLGTSDWHNTVLQPGSLAVSGPGVTASAGPSSVTLETTPSVAFATGLTRDYFIDLTPVSFPMTIEQRTVSVTTQNSSYVYGSPRSVVSLSNIVNGDAIVPMSSVNGGTSTAMLPIDAGFGYAATLAAGSANYVVNALSGAAASNYRFDPAATLSGNISIDQKALNYQIGSGTQTYGQLNAMPSVQLTGKVGSDDVSAVSSLTSSAGPVTLTARTAVGSYQTVVTDLSGTAAGNYRLATTGNVNPNYLVSPRPLFYTAGDHTSVYGTTALFDGSYTNLLPGDSLSVVNTLNQNQQTFAATPTLPVGIYGIAQNLSGPSAANYVVSRVGNSGSLSVTPKSLSYVVGSNTQVFGADIALPTPVLSGIVGSDQVAASTSLSPFEAHPLSASGKLVVGGYAVDISRSLTGTSSGNYVLGSGVQGALFVVPKPVTYQLGATSQIYGTVPAAGTALNGVLAGDTVAADLYYYSSDGVASFQARANTPVGNYSTRLGVLSGFGSSNYVLAQTGNTNGTLSITPKTLSWNVSDAVSVYGDALSNQTALGLVQGDVVRAELAAFDASGALVSRPVVGTGYTAHVTALSGPSASNYLLASSGNQAGAVTISPREIFPLSLVPRSTEYGTAVGLQVLGSGLLPEDRVVLANVDISSNRIYGGDITGSAPAQPRSAAGDYTAYIRSLTNPNYMLARNFDVSTVKALYSIEKKHLDYSIPDSTAVYGSYFGNNPAVTLTGLLPGDDVYAFSPGIYDSGSLPERVPVGAYSYAIPKLSGRSSYNYEISSSFPGLGLLTILPRPLSIELDVKVAGMSSNSQGLMEQNYGVLTPTSINIQSKVVSGVLPGDEATVVLASPNLSTSGSGKLQVGYYRWSAGAVSNPNYTVGYSDSFTLVINPLAANYVPTAYYGSSNNVRPSSVYGESAGTEVRSAMQGVLPGDRVVPGAGTFNNFNSAAGDLAFLSNRADAGTYLLQSAAPTGLDSKNYAFTTSVVRPQFTITPRPADVRIQATNSVYGDQGKYGAVVFGGILAGDDISAVLTGAVDRFKDIGNYEVKIKEFVGSDAGNYAFNVGAPNVSLVGKWTVLPRPVTVSGDKSSIEVVYGDGDFLTRILSVSNVAENGLLTVVARAEKDNQRYDFNNNRIDAGRYTIVPQLVGPFASNYVIDNGRPGERAPINFGVLQINKRPLVTQIARELEYGGTPAPVLGNVATGDNGKLDVAYKYSNVFSDRGLRYGFLDVGGTKIEAVPGSASLWRNYVAPELTFFDVVPRTLQFDSRVFEYGKIYEDDRGNLTSTINPNGIDLGRPTNLVGDDNIRGVVRPSFDNSIIQFRGSNDPSDPKGFVLTAPLAVGEKSFTGTVRQQLSPGGPAEISPYYRIAESTLKIKTIQRPVYTSETQTRQYGNFAVNCPDGCDPYVSGVVRFGNVIGNEDVYAGLLLPDPNSFFGRPTIPVDGKTPVGQYKRVSVSPLAGKDAGNYILAGSNTLPNAITLTVQPLYLQYATTSALVVGEYVFGSFGVATLKGPYGNGPINGDDVAPVVTMKVGDTVVPGLLPLEGAYGVRHDYFVTSLTGKDAANYRIYPQNTFLGIPGRNNHNIVGSVTQVADTSFGFADSSPQLLVATVPTKPPEVVSPPPILYKPANLATTSAVIDGNATNTSLTSGTASVSGQASSAIDTSGSTELGNAQGTGQAQGSANASLTAGPAGAQVTGTLAGAVSGGVTFGPGEVRGDVTGSTSVKGKIGPTGIKAGAEVAVQANVTTTVQGDMGSGVNGNAALNAGAAGGAITSAEAGYVDGKVGTKVETLAGGGVSVGGQVGLVTNAGSLNTGVSVYSPGLVGGKIDLSGGYSGGSIRIAVNLGAAIGIGGLSVKLDFSIDVANMADKLSAFNEDLKYMSTMSGPTAAELAESKAQKAIKFAGSFGTDKLARLAFLTTTSEWSSGGNVGGFGEAQRDFRDFNNLKAAITQLQKDKAKAQETLLRLMETDPAGAASWFSQNNYVEDFAKREFDVKSKASALGIQFTNTDGTMRFSNL